MLQIETTETAPSAWRTLRQWTPRHVLAAAVGAVVVALLIGVPTDVIPNPVFGRPVPVTWWSYPTLVVTAVLGGLLIGTYVRRGTAPPSTLDEIDTPTRNGSVAGLLSFFAVGCPVCNKLVLVALGSSGALSWWAPLQPVLGLLAVGVLALTLRSQLRRVGSLGCERPT